MEFPPISLDGAALAVSADSQLGTLAHLNPSACIQFANALLKDLDGALAACTLGNSATSIAARFEQIHTLKNMVISTGCKPLADACAALQSLCLATGDPARARETFDAIAQAAQRLIANYRDGMVARAG
ncbi:Hpt domain-containing protein [Rhodanobacter sp. 115]|uniref:Hpt domain-containing protein n=1 Tax=Rhodanobacter sp. FW021-MT20 TaxID=1162282 RepID=UPI0034E51C13